MSTLRKPLPKLLDPLVDKELFPASTDGLWDGSGFLMAIAFLGVIFLVAIIAVEGLTY